MSRVVNRSYSADEMAIIRRGAVQGLNCKELASELPGRPIESIKNKLLLARTESGQLPILADSAFRTSTEVSSAALRDAILALFARTAAARGCTITEAARAALAHRPKQGACR